MDGIHNIVAVPIMLLDGIKHKTTAYQNVVISTFKPDCETTFVLHAWTNISILQFLYITNFLVRLG